MRFGRVGCLQSGLKLVFRFGPMGRFQSGLSGRHMILSVFHCPFLGRM